MGYTIDKENYRINIEGNTNEIRNWLISLEKAITKGSTLPMIEDDIKNLEDITEQIQFNPTARDRIYFNKNSILYVPNSSLKVRGFWFKMLEDNFNDAIQYNKDKLYKE